MKLATYRDGSRDGQLVVVSRDLSLAHFASGVATRLQQVLDDWNFLSPQLQEISQTLNHGKARHAFAFDPRLCMAPLPRAYHCSSANAYLSHLERLHRATDTDLPKNLRDAPRVHLRASDELAGPTDEVVAAGAAVDLDFSGEIAVVTGDLAAGTAPEAALEGIRLLMLVNDMGLREPNEPGPSSPWTQTMTAFGPVAVTPDELLAAWQDGRVHLNLECTWNGRRFGLVDAAQAMQFGFGELIALLCKARPLRAGSIVGSGTVSHPDADRGTASIAERRALETLSSGAPKTGFLMPGDTLRFDMKGADGHSVFGAIAQHIGSAEPDGPP